MQIENRSTLIFRKICDIVLEKIHVTNGFCCYSDFLHQVIGKVKHTSVTFFENIPAYKSYTINASQIQPPEVFSKKDVLENFAKHTGKHFCQSLFLIKLPCEVCEIFKNTFFTEHLRVTASGISQ